MKTIFSLLIISIIALSAQAQFKKSTSFSYSISEPFEQFPDYMPEHYAMDDHLFSIRHSSSSICIEKFSTDNDNLIKRTIVELDKGFVVYKVLNIDDNFYVLFTKNEERLDHELYAMQLDIHKGTFVSETKHIGSVEADQESRDLNPGSVFKQPKIYSKLLDNGNILLCYEIYMNNFYVQGMQMQEAKNFNRLRIIELNSSFDVIIDKHIDYSKASALLTDIHITGTGKIFTETKKFKDGTKRLVVDKSINFDWRIFEINVVDNTVTEHELELKNGAITSLDLFILDNDNIYAGGGFTIEQNGYVSHRCYSGTTNGVVINKLTSNEFKLFSQVNYSKELIESYNPGTKRTESTMQGIELENIYSTKNGDVIFSTACIFDKTEGSASIGHFEDLIIGKLDKNGALKWAEKIPVQSVSSVSNSLIYTTFMGQSNIYTVLIDHPENAELNLNEKAERHIDYYPGDIVAYKVSLEDGSAEKMILFNTEKAYKRKFYHLDVMNVNNNIVTFESYVKGNEDVFVKMKFEE